MSRVSARAHYHKHRDEKRASMQAYYQKRKYELRLHRRARYWKQKAEKQGAQNKGGCAVEGGVGVNVPAEHVTQWVEQGAE